MAWRQTWYNQVRTLKPQTFKSGEAEPEDPTAGGRGCDFCDARTLTAEDVFGRVERPTCMTASNLFKYCAPYHGLVVFKARDPLPPSPTSPATSPSAPQSN